MNWIIGDIHGMLEEFKSVLAQIDEHDPDAKIWCVGDFCDRGYDSKGVVDIILAGGNKFKCVRGNHDDVFHCIVSGKATPYSEDQSSEAPLASLSWFSNYGMIDTLGSYGIEKDEVKAGMRSLFALRGLMDRIPQDHIDFYSNLPLVEYGEGFFIAHAYVPPDSTVEHILQYASHRQNILWGRFEVGEVSQTKSWGKTGYFGHTPTHTRYQSKDPVFGEDIVLVDTGAVFGNALSAVCHETGDIIQSTHPSDKLGL